MASMACPDKRTEVPRTFAESWGEKWGADCVTFNPDCVTKTPTKPALDSFHASSGQLADPWHKETTSNTDPGRMAVGVSPAKRNQPA